MEPTQNTNPDELDATTGPAEPILSIPDTAGVPDLTEISNLVADASPSEPFSINHSSEPTLTISMDAEPTTSVDVSDAPDMEPISMMDTSASSVSEISETTSLEPTPESLSSESESAETEENTENVESHEDSNFEPSSESELSEPSSESNSSESLSESEPTEASGENKTDESQEESTPVVENTELLAEAAAESPAVDPVITSSSMSPAPQKKSSSTMSPLTIFLLVACVAVGVIAILLLTDVISFH